MKQTELAKILRLESSQYISNVERGKSWPSLKKLSVWVVATGADPGKVRSMMMQKYKKRLDKFLGMEG